MSYAHHYETVVETPASPDELFRRLDDQSVIGDAVVTAREPPRLTWEPRGAGKPSVLGACRVGFKVAAGTGGGSAVRVFVDYDLPEAPLQRLAGALLAPMAARRLADGIAGEARRIAGAGSAAAAPAERRGGQSISAA